MTRPILKAHLNPKLGIVTEGVAPLRYVAQRLGITARVLRRKGLKVARVGNVDLVSGRHLAEFVEAIATKR